MNRKIAVVWLLTLATSFSLGLVIGLRVAEQSLFKEAELSVPADIAWLLSERFKFVNEATGRVLRDHKLIGGVVGRYVEGGELYETYVLGFEDRPGGASADQDYLDLMVEVKRVKGSNLITVRMVQLGLDRILVYLDDELIGVVKPSIEVQVRL